jgi:hypothetical protein
MNFEVKLPQRMGTWALRAAGLYPTAEYFDVFHHVYENKVTLPATVSCPYFPSEKPVGVRVTVCSFSPVNHFKIEIEDEAIGNRIREKLIHYSGENHGLAVSDREHEELYARIDEILKPDGVTTKDIERGTVVLTRRAQQALMRLHDEVEYIRRGNIFWQFTKSAIPKTDRVFVARWLLKCFAAEKDPLTRNDIDTVFLNHGDLIVRELADDAIRLLKDSRYGVSRSGLIHILAKLKHPQAAELIASVMDEDRLVWSALRSLGILKARQHETRVRKYLRDPDSEIRLEAKRTLKKMGCDVDKAPPPIHLVKGKKSIPKDLEEWSANLDFETLEPVLKSLAGCVHDGFGSQEVAEILGVAEETKPEQTKAFRFVVNGGMNELWVAVFMDDINSPDLYVHSHPELIKKFAATVDLPD